MVRKYLLFLTLLLAMMFSGCGGFERYVEGNTFYSSGHPKIKIEFSNSYEYVGEEKQGLLGTYDNAELMVGPSIDRNKYIFKNEKDNIKSFTTIEIINMDSGFVQAFMTSFKDIRIENVIKEGKLLENSDFYYFIFPIEYITKDNDARCLLIKYMGKTVGDNTRFEVSYFENIAEKPGEKHTCQEWSNRESLTEEQVAFLEQFSNRAAQNITFMENW